MIEGISAGQRVFGSGEYASGGLRKPVDGGLTSREAPWMASSGSGVDTSSSRSLVQHHRWVLVRQPEALPSPSDGRHIAGQEDPDATSTDFDPSPSLEELEPDGLAASAGLAAILKSQTPELSEQYIGEGGKP